MFGPGILMRSQMISHILSASTVQIVKLLRDQVLASGEI
jgi:hypothetical protein